MKTQQMQEQNIEGRLYLLETRLAELEKKINEPKPELRARKDWHSIIGISADDPFYGKVVAAGAEWRRTSRNAADD